MHLLLVLLEINIRHYVEGHGHVVLVEGLRLEGLGNLPWRRAERGHNLSLLRGSTSHLFS